MKIKVPEGMLEAAVRGIMPKPSELGAPYMDNPGLIGALEAALRWLDEKLESMEKGPKNECLASYNMAIDDMRRMFAAPDEDEAIKDLLAPKSPFEIENYVLIDSHNEDIREAYRRGPAR